MQQRAPRRLRTCAATRPRHATIKKGGEARGGADPVGRQGKRPPRRDTRGAGGVGSREDARSHAPGETAEQRAAHPRGWRPGKDDPEVSLVEWLGTADDDP